MKKFILTVLCLVTVLFVLLSGCQKNSPSAPAATSTPTPNATQTAAALQTAGPAAQATATAQAQLTADAQATATMIAVKATMTAAAIATITATAQAGTISGTITLPSAHSGDMYGIGVFNDIYNLSGQQPVNFTFGTLSASNTLTYSLSAAPGKYYVFAYTMSSSSPYNSPTFGDFIGVYGTVYPVFPSSANVTVGIHQAVTADFTMGTITKSISGTITLPASVTSTHSNTVFVTQSLPAFINSNSFDNNSMTSYQSSISSGNTMDYSLPNILPGQYYVAAGVDIDDSGNVSTGDYVGYSPITLNPANDQIKNFSLSIQP